VETSRPTTHEHPTFIEEGVIHYCVPNIGSIVARTSTYAFLNAAFPYLREIAEKDRFSDTRKYRNRNGNCNL
jgi:alanine dehydrogenase